MTIHFGTDGWRAVISDTFTFTNLRLVAQAIADAVASPEWINGTPVEARPDPRKMVVGFDTRFLSDRYATEVARVLAANGFTVFLAQADAPTPVISHAVRNLNAIGGVMITASHNAPRYNGIKLKSASGGSALPEQCRRVEVYLNDNETLARGPNLMDLEQARSLKLIQRFNPIPAYYEHLRTLIDCDIIAENPQRFVIDSMYGSGRGVIRGFLQGTGCEIAEIRGEMNPGFGAIHPEPIAKYLGALASAVSSGMGNFGVVTDGDIRSAILHDMSLDTNVAAIMTRDPITVEKRELATEALNLMEAKRITSLVVVGADDRVAGVIHLHDLWRTEMF